MTEAKWLRCTDPRVMLQFVSDRASERKLRLFAASCCRRVWHLLVHQESKDSVEALERYADGQLDKSGFTNAWVAASHVRIIRNTRKTDRSPEKTAAWAVSTALFPETLRGVSSTAAQVKGLGHVPAKKEGRRQCADLRDLFGNPFRSVQTDPAWLTAAVASLAQAAYDERLLPGGELDPPRLAILADALEEAGCADAAILSHLRGAGPHVRGCWAIDLLLGKE
jgi:hypothetical protein